MQAETAIAMLDRQLSAHGVDVTITRSGVAPFSLKAMVRGMGAEQLRTGSVTTQAQSRAILSPTSFPAGFLPLRTTDKLTWNGSQRSIVIATPVMFGATVVRVEADFQG